MSQVAWDQQRRAARRDSTLTTASSCGKMACRILVGLCSSSRCFFSGGNLSRPLNSAGVLCNNVLSRTFSRTVALGDDEGEESEKPKTRVLKPRYNATPDGVLRTFEVLFPP